LKDDTIRKWVSRSKGGGFLQFKRGRPSPVDAASMKWLECQISREPYDITDKKFDELVQAATVQTAQSRKDIDASQIRPVSHKTKRYIEKVLGISTVKGEITTDARAKEWVTSGMQYQWLLCNL
jgi:transposase